MIICARRSDSLYAEITLLEFLFQGIEAEIKYSRYVPKGQIFLIDPKQLIYDPDIEWSWDA